MTLVRVLIPMPMPAVFVLAVLVSERAQIAEVATALDPVVSTIKASKSDTHIAQIEACIPTDKRALIDLMLPVWSPGYYGLGDYAKEVSDFAAHTPDGSVLAFEKTAEELDYSEALDWFGLRFSEPGSADAKKAWALEPGPHATDAQKLHLPHFFNCSAR